MSRLTSQGNALTRLSRREECFALTPGLSSEQNGRRSHGGQTMSDRQNNSGSARNRTDGPPLALISKSRDERIYVALTVFDSTPCVDIRVHTRAGVRDVPTSRGLTMTVETFAIFMAGLKQAERKVRAFGLFEEDKRTRGRRGG